MIGDIPMRALLIITLFGLFITPAWSSNAGPVGVWITQKGRSLINIAPCNANQTGNANAVLCSKIIWLKKPFNDEGEPLRDKANKNPSLRRRPILGMPILLNMQPHNEGGWLGKVYNPEDGKVYRAQMFPQGRRKLLVKGCAKVLFNWVCKERLWQRASEEAIQASGMPLEPKIGSRY